MKQILASIVALGMVAVFAGSALAGGEFGCSYESHSAKQVKDKADTSQATVNQVTDKAESTKLVLAQDAKATPSASEPRK